MPLKPVSGEIKSQEINDNFSFLDSNKASKQDLADVAKGSPKEVHDTLAALQNKYPNGDDGIHLVLSNGHIYFWKNNAWTDAGEYQERGIGEKAVAPKNTTFIKASSNLFNKNRVIKGYTINGTDGTLVANSVQSVMEEGIIVQPATTFIVGGNGPTCRWAFYSPFGVFINSGTSLTFTSPETTSILKLVIRIDNLDTAQLNEGTVLLPYEDYYTLMSDIVEIPLDTTKIELTYTNGRLEKVEEKLGDSSTRVSTLNYENEQLKDVTEKISGQTVRSTLNYNNGTLTSVSRTEL